ncbi:MAG: chlorite dismutase family protein [Actinobacteria bacterium]|nr:MAG: chlorite dismutase family protein [Actinomycetota bacterium]
MATFKLLTLAFKLRRGWARIPPAQRRRLLKQAGKQARKHGPTVARGLNKAAKQARRLR